MKIDILTLFPDMFKGPFDESIIKRAIDKNIVEIKIYNLREWADDKHNIVDDRPYGGGVGMVMKVDIVDRAVKDLKKNNKATESNVKVILIDTKGKKYTQKKAKKLSNYEHLILICGHYEGVDHRVHDHIADEIISIGDYILTGGEIPAMVITDSIVRLIPGVLEKEDAAKYESYSPHISGHTSNLLLEAPHYTRPEKYLGWKVPKVLLSGNHKEIELWRSKRSKEITKKLRPDLISTN